jgi:hypothetical protein
MKANYCQNKLPQAKPFERMTEKELRAWNATEAYRMQEYEAIANAMLVSMLYYFASEQGYGAVRLRRIWEGMIRTRVTIRRDLRIQDGAYELAATYHNVEDYCMREELRKKGCDVLEWEKGVTMDAHEGVHFAPWGKEAARV